MRNRFTAAVIVLSIGLAACGDDSSGDEAADAQTTVEPGDDTATDSGTTGESPASGTAADQPTQTSGADPAAEVEGDPDGELRIAYQLVSSTIGAVPLDPGEHVRAFSSLGLYHWIYGGLFRPGPNETLIPDLAEDVTVVDPNTLEVHLREGLTLSDGSPLDAQLVKASLERNLANTETSAFEDRFRDLKSVEVVDETTVRLTIPDGTAAGWADAQLASAGAVIVPPDTDFSMPVGAGPFVVAEFVPEERLVLERNPEYWDAESIDVGRIEVVNAPDTRAATSALNAGQVDWTRIEYGDIDAVASNFETTLEPDADQLVSIGMCKAEEPFSIPEVREALSLAIDREAINEALLGGAGAPASGIHPDDHPLHDPELTGSLEYDPEAARALLADAGYPNGFEFDQTPAPQMELVSQIVQQQLAEIGVTMNILPSANYVNDFYIEGRVPVSVTPTTGGAGIRRISQWTGDSIANVCHYEDPELNQLAQEIDTVRAADDEAKELWHSVEQIVVEDTLSIPILFRPEVVAYDPERLDNVQPTAYAAIVPEVRELVIKPN